MPGWSIVLIIFGGAGLMLLFIYIAYYTSLPAKADDEIKNYRDKIENFKLTIIPRDNSFEEKKDLLLVKNMRDNLIKKDDIKISTFNLFLNSECSISKREYELWENGNKLLSSNGHPIVELPLFLNRGSTVTLFDLKYLKRCFNKNIAGMFLKKDWSILTLCVYPKDYIEQKLKKKQGQVLEEFDNLSKTNEMTLNVAKGIYDDYVSFIDSLYKPKQYYYHKPTGLLLEVNTLLLNTEKI